MIGAMPSGPSALDVLVSFKALLTCPSFVVDGCVSGCFLLIFLWMLGVV